MDNLEIIKKLGDSYVRIYIYDLSLRKTTFLSKGVMSMMQYSHEHHDKACEDLNLQLEQIDERINHYLQCTNKNDVCEYQFKLRRQDGKYLYVLLQECMLCETEDGKPLHLIGQLYEITTIINNNRKLDAERKLRELLVKREQKLKKMAILKSMESERSRIAREIHDGLGQVLTGLKMSIQALGEDIVLSDDNLLLLKRINLQLKDAIIEARRLSNNISPNDMAKYGLQSIISHFIDTYVQSQFKNVKFESNLQSTRYDAYIELEVFRVIQECVNNAVKHSKAKEIKIKLEKSSQNLSVIVQDDGVGFDYHCLILILHQNKS